jgi:hypothetical protein
VSQRTLLIVALGLMAAGLLLGTITAIVGGVSPVESRQVQGPQEGPNGQVPGPGGFLPGHGGFRGGAKPAEGSERPLPGIVPSPKPTPTPTA